MTTKQERFYASWFLFIACVLLAMMFIFSGCDSPPQEPEAKLKYNIEKFHLPPGTIKVEVLNDEWHVFTLRIDGGNRRFLRRAHSFGNDSATDTMTELSR